MRLSVLILNDVFSGKIGEGPKGLVLDSWIFDGCAPNEPLDVRLCLLELRFVRGEGEGDEGLEGSRCDGANCSVFLGFLHLETESALGELRWRNGSRDSNLQFEREEGVGQVILDVVPAVRPHHHGCTRPDEDPSRHAKVTQEVLPHITTFCLL